MKLFEFGNHFSRVFCLAAALAALSGCLDGSNSSGTLSTRASQSSLSFDHLPDPTTWSEERLYHYFLPLTSSNVEGTIHWREHTVSSKLEELCGPISPVIPPRGNFGWGQKIRDYQAAKEQTPDLIACWSNNAPSVIVQREAEIRYLKMVVPYVRGISYRWVMSSGDVAKWDPRTKDTDIMAPNYTVEPEIEDLHWNMERLVNRNASIDRSIARARGYQQNERDSWRRAATWALNDFARDNPFNRPGPGQIASGWLNGSSALNPSMFPASDPRSRAAIINYNTNVAAANSPVQRTLISLSNNQLPINCLRVPGQDRCLSASEYNAWVANNRDDMANNIEQSRLAADRWHETAQAQVSSLLEDERRAREQGYRSSSDRTGGSDVVAE